MTPLLTETVMIDHVGAGYVAFTSRDVELDRPLAVGTVTPAGTTAAALAEEAPVDERTAELAPPTE